MQFTFGCTLPRKVPLLKYVNEKLRTMSLVSAMVEMEYVAQLRYCVTLPIQMLFIVSRVSDFQWYH